MRHIGNNDGRLYIFLNGSWKKIKTVDLEITTTFDSSEYSVSGDTWKNSYVGQGMLEGSFRTPWLVEVDSGNVEDLEALEVVKFLETIVVPEDQCKLNGHKLRLVSLNPTCASGTQNKPYRIVEFTASLSPNEPLVGSDLSEITYLGFEIGYQGGFTVTYGDDSLDDLNKLLVEAQNTVETLNTTDNTVDVTGLAFTATNNNGAPYVLNEKTNLLLSFKVVGSTTPISVVGFGDEVVLKQEFTNLVPDFTTILTQFNSPIANLSKVTLTNPVQLPVNVNRKALVLTAHVLKLDDNGSSYTQKELEVTVINSSIVSTSSNQFTPEAV